LMRMDNDEILNEQFYRDHLLKIDINKLQEFKGERPDFSSGKVFNREAFLKKEMPKIKAAKPEVQPAPKEARVTRAKAVVTEEKKEKEPEPEQNVGVRPSARERKGGRVGLMYA
jgi:hypothetical protein